MYNERPNLIFGFHGCDETVRDYLLLNPNKIKISEEIYDWLGHGMYFWENNYDRALVWAKDKKKRGTLNKPSVIGAILQLGNCCDLTDRNSIDVVKSYYALLKDDHAKVGKDLPVNKDLKHDEHKDMLLRELDCTVFEYMHKNILETYSADMRKKGYSDFKLFDSTRGVFTEGGPAFREVVCLTKATFKYVLEIQIALRDFLCRARI